ncbi:MAG: UDP-N-acetylmuramoylalanyl-D-glutamyl-2, 6-diaminopimelate--D-alanyl-D-alanine ligase [Chloroflexi bacterium]|nr:MAG: UDP-N-acetylmuramoylalanyl-D-glutamyl-2, 6-diaminopimelate--D-alanyl-D-alanine ligase [Chloroflexota bacterium]
MLTLGYFFKILAGVETTGNTPAVSCVVVDSHEAVPGSVFVALPGEKVDGHQYIADAFARGAIAALVEQEQPNFPTWDLRQPHTWGDIRSITPPVCILVENTVKAMQDVAQAWREQFDTKVIGITGSVGKTSTKELTHSVLSQRFNTLKSPGNRNSILGLPPVLLNLAAEHEYAVFEMGMYTTREIARLCAIAKPTIGVVTMIGPVHLARAGSMEAIVAAKQELVEALPADGVAILNKDNAYTMSMAPHTKARVFTYGLNPNADLWADNIESMGLEGVRFTLHQEHEALNVQVPLIGQHSVHTSLRAAAVGLATGLSWEEIITGLSSSQIQLRLVAVSGPNDSTIIDDTYNSSPDSAMAALNLLSDLNGRHVAVMGDMLELGFMEEEGHRFIGRRVADVAQILVAMGSRARWIADEAMKVGMPARQVFLVDDVETAVSTLHDLIQPRDIVLVKGSLGMNMGQIVSALTTEPVGGEA